MSYYTVTLALAGTPAPAAAVEWAASPAGAPVPAGGWQPCLRQPDGTWRFASHDPAAGLHRRAPGRFADLAIRYRLDPAGPWSAASADRKEIVILAVAPEEPEEPGEPQEPELHLPPVAAVLPSLAGAGVIGTELALDPGAWTGFPAPVLSFQWRRDGAPIPGAAARAYAPGPQDDGCVLDCLVAAASVAGRAEAVAGPVTVRYAPPRLRADLPEEVFDEAEGVEAVETAQAFEGEALRFSAEGFAIDAASGVLSLPVDAPVAGGIVRIVARNSGGAAEAVLRYTVEGAPGRTLGAGDVTVLRSVWRPAGQSVTFAPELAFPGLAGETVQAIQFTTDTVTGAAGAAAIWHPVRAEAGAAGVWRPEDARHPVATGAADAGLWRADDPRRTGRLRFRWRVSELHPWSEAGTAQDVPVPAPALASVFAPSAEAVAEAISGGLVSYRVESSGGDGEGNPSTPVYAKWDTFLPVLYLWSGRNGRFAVSGGSKEALERVVEQLLRWASDAGDAAPACRSGYHGQHEMRFVATVALARITPVVWDHPRLNDSPKWKTRLDLLMKGCLVANAVIASDAPRPFGDGWGRERTIRGYTAGRNNAPNFSSPPRLTPHVVAAYMSANGEDPVAFMNGFRRAAFSAQMAAVGGMNEARATFAQDWTPAFQTARYGAPSALGRGFTAAEIERALRNDGNGPWRCLGHTLAMPRETFQRELERNFSRPVVPGPRDVQKPAGTQVGETGPGWTTRHGVKYGSQTRNQLRACLGAPLASGVTDKSAWARLPNPGAMGMHLELDTTDGGEAGGPNVRSAPSYAVSALGATMIAFTTMILYGRFDPTDASWRESRTRFQVGVRDLNFRARHGHRGYSKGGFGSSNNEDFGPAWIASQGVKWDSFMNLMDLVAAWWGLPPFPADD